MAKKGKYYPLYKYLFNSNKESLTLTFAEIEAIINDKLPPSARKYSAFWSNQDDSHTTCKSWGEAGYNVFDLDLVNEEVTFRREK